MAFNWQTFKTRTLTAILFVILMAAGLLINEWCFLMLFSIIHFGCWWEYLRIIEKIHKVLIHPYVKLGLMLIGYGILLLFCRSAVDGYVLKDNISLPVTIAGFVFLILGIFQKTKINLRAFAGAAAGIIYISLSWGLLVRMEIPRLSPYPYPYSIPIFIILTMWINDTMAYIVGSLIGKTPLSKISPKKTWEGTVGGVILAVIVIGILASVLIPLNGISNIVWYIFAAIAAIAGTFGDLLESKLKRMANLKDSGHIMPGHGGFLDRFDSLLLAIPFSFLYIFLIDRLYPY
jgi:phosphatidate cytidylyltransferase